MIDGITIKYKIGDFEAWKMKVKIPFFDYGDMDNVTIKTKKREDYLIITYEMKWETLTLIIDEAKNHITGSKFFYLRLRGSLHSNHHDGKNYLPFTWQQLQDQLTHICNKLDINALQAKISTLEVGVNVVTPFEVLPFLLRNCINYKARFFNRYEEAGFCLGILCESHSQYEIKIYDKGKQYDLPQNLMRFEKRFFRMQVLNRMGIKYLSDLLIKVNVLNLLPMLLEAWQNVLIYDITPGQNLTIMDTLKEEESNLLTTGQNPGFWEQLKEKNVRQFNYQREKFKNLVAKNGKKWQQFVTDLIQKEWQTLFKNCTNLQSVENAKLYNLTSTIRSKNVQNRFCQTCGREITHQKGGSKFCGAKYVGYEAAHQCRNNSNNLKYKIEKIQRRGVLFDIMPFIVTIQKSGDHLFGNR